MSGFRGRLYGMTVRGHINGMSFSSRHHGVLLAIISLLVLILAKNEEQILALERRTNVPLLGRLTEDVSSQRTAVLG